MGDEESTRPNASIESIRRQWAAREHFNRMTKLARILAAATGAQMRGATFHYRGDWVA